MFEQAFRNIDKILWAELRPIAEIEHAEQNSGPCFRDYIDGLAQDRADETRRLLERLEEIPDEADHALARYLFAAAISELMTSGRVATAPPCHFFLLTTVELDAFLAELAGMAACEWGKNSRSRIPVHRETRSVALSVRATKDMCPRHDQYVRPSKNAKQFPYLMDWLQRFSSTAGNGTLQLARIVKLKARGQVYSHVDRGLYYLLRDRYHLVLKSRSGSRMQCESQTSVWFPAKCGGSTIMSHIRLSMIVRMNESM